MVLAGEEVAELVSQQDRHQRHREHPARRELRQRDGRLSKDHPGADVEGREEVRAIRVSGRPIASFAAARRAVACALRSARSAILRSGWTSTALPSGSTGRSSSPNAASTRELSIADHGLIGDGFSAALVRADGAIDWLCMPRFDSPSVFAALLDEENGGSTSVSPVDYPFESLQRYDPGTNVLETLFRVDGRGTIRLTDYMPWTDDPRSAVHEVHRRVQCVEGEAVVKVVFDPRFDYGRVARQFEIDGRSALAKGASGERLVAVLGGVGRWEQRPKAACRPSFD